MEAVLLQPICLFINGSRHRCRFSRWLQWSWSRLGAWVFRISQAEAAATASGRRSGSCHHDIRHPWPPARRLGSICGSAASRGKIRHRRPWPRIDQVVLGINRRWQEEGLHELGCRRLQPGPLSGFVEHLCLATTASAECHVALGSSVTTHSNDLNANNAKLFLKKKSGQRSNEFFLKKKNDPVRSKDPQVAVLP